MARGKRWLIVGGIGMLFGALLHLAALLGGPYWIAFVGAPPSVVRSAEAGTLLAPVSTFAIIGLLVVWALYAFSGAGILRQLPFRRLMLAAVAVIFTLRGLVILPFLHRVDWRSMHDLFVVFSSGFILAIGASYALGLWLTLRHAKSAAVAS
ncbi:hypothetical protein [Brevundimonas sp.]|uniref:hypothetical protein n=1 Tax=Brevundimonas sp. TaxID=1871086 RepID=UPI0035B18E6C